MNAKYISSSSPDIETNPFMAFYKVAKLSLMTLRRTLNFPISYNITVVKLE